MSSVKSGHNFERRIATELRDDKIYPRAKRIPGQTNKGGALKPDVGGTPWWLECKHTQKLNVKKVYELCMEQTDGRPALIVWRIKQVPGQKCRTLAITSWSEWKKREALLAQMRDYLVESNNSSRTTCPETNPQQEPYTQTAETLLKQLDTLLGHHFE